MDLLTMAQAGTVVDIAALGMLALGLAGVAVKRLEVAIVFLALQGVLLGVATGAAALAEGGWRAWAAFGIALAVKVVAIPVMLWFVLNRVTARHEVESVVPLKLAVPLAIGLVLFAYWVARPIASDTLGGQHGFDAPNALPAAMALLLLGLFTMSTRRKALTQVIGLVTMENGIYLAAVAATRGLPIAVEFGIALDVLTGAALMALVAHEINRMFVSIDTDRLRSLRG
ncbi:MAG TPA: NADH-quinone oxidoreductase subunit K [Thermomicrobiales bacterium]|nr:NADH-quinone oxidoreductase subunit K [Thermomicrobiales bacterium]